MCIYCIYRANCEGRLRLQSFACLCLRYTLAISLTKLANKTRIRELIEIQQIFINTAAAPPILTPQKKPRKKNRKENCCV